MKNLLQRQQKMAGEGGGRRQSPRLRAMITAPNPSQNQGNALSAKQALPREPAAASQTFANCSSPNARRPICFSGSAKRIKKAVNDEARPQVATNENEESEEAVNDEARPQVATNENEESEEAVNDEARPQLATNENEESEDHSSSQVSPSYQAVVDKIWQSLSPRQTIIGSRIGRIDECGEIPSSAIQNGNPSVCNAVSNEHTLSLEPAITSNLAREQQYRISNHQLGGMTLNRTHSFGLTELVGMWGDSDSDIR